MSHDVERAVPPPPPDVTGALPGFGVRLRRLRRACGFKQAHVARLAGVDQASVSRWESGAASPSPARAAAVLAMLQPARAEDAALRRLVESSSLVVHLVTDVDHVLLAASPRREAEWGVSATSLRGRSLWDAASPAIRVAESTLESRGWWEHAQPPPVEIELDAHDNGFLPIVAGRMVWERVWLGDGRPARLCTLSPHARVGQEQGVGRRGLLSRSIIAV